MKTTLKTTLAAAALALAAITGVHAQAASAKPLSIAVFDTQKVMNGTNAAKKASADLMAKSKDAQSRINALEKPLIEKRQKLIGQQGVMAADKFKQASDEFAKELDTFRGQALKIQSDLDQEIVKTRKRISDAVGQAVEQIAKEKSYDLVLPKGMIIYTGPNVTDISADAMARANKMLDK